MIFRTIYEGDRSCLLAYSAKAVLIAGSTRAKIISLGPSSSQSGLPVLLNLGLYSCITPISNSLAIDPSTGSQDKQAPGYSVEIEPNRWCDLQREWILTAIPTYSNTPSAHAPYRPADLGNSPRLVIPIIGASRNAAYADSVVSVCSIYFPLCLAGVATASSWAGDSSSSSLKASAYASATKFIHPDTDRLSRRASCTTFAYVLSSSLTEISLAMSKTIRVFCVNVNSECAKVLDFTLHGCYNHQDQQNSPTKRVKHSAGPSHQQQVRLLNG